MGSISIDNGLKHYFKEIKLLFPVYGDEEKKFIAHYKADINEYIISNPDSSYEQIVLTFGEPKTIVSRYMAEADAEYLYKQIRTARFIRIGIVVIVIAVVVAAASIVVIKYADFVKGQAQYIDREVTEITTESVE
ncbi:MAG: hypothetical protein LBG82_06965 [Clostridiales Family XIII bacterium]|jgi:hypothetical protein|nr:hypothetical protein [Clostridiales Family XIII bacterium]